MDTERWQRIGAIFDATVEVAPEERAALLDRLCGADAQIRREVESMLAADAAGAQFDGAVDSARQSAAADWADSNDAEPADRRIGPWRMLRELGRGGMGVVWLAERADGQFEQRAALKLIKRGMDSEAVIARFLRERQILAQLDHAHIARLLDGGLAADGRPYFAMEFIDGRPLLAHCAALGIKLEERIKIFLDICSALQFAHGRLVVHRDIKPSNVMVAADGSVKLLDFGIAKLLAADEGSAATTTALGQDRPLTLAYAAPEHVRGQPVTVATDIYSLGVLLYELLTGRRPFDFSDVPSTEDFARAWQTPAQGPPAPSRRAQADAPVPPRRLRGDLDTIVLKALQHEPQRRYATVEALAGDLRRYLQGQPIAARRDSAGYRIGKFVVRHKLGVAGATLSAVLLIAALGVAVWQARAKSREAQAAQEVTRFVVSLFDAADPTHARGASISAEDLLDQGAQRMRSQLGAEPEVRARLLYTIATSYIGLGLYDRALPLAEQSRALRSAQLAPGDAELADSVDQLGRIYMLKADYAQAEPLLRQALETRRANLPEDDPAVIDSLGNLGVLLQHRGNFQDADAAFHDALTAAERHFGPNATQTAARLDAYAANMDDLGKGQDAVALLRRALAIRERDLDPDDPEVAASLQNLGSYLDAAGESPQAQKLLERALAIRRKVFGVEHPLVAFTEVTLSGAYEYQGRADDAENMAQHALGVLRRSLPDDHPKIAETLNMLAIIRTTRRDFVGAVPLFREALDRLQHSLGPDHPDSLAAKGSLAVTLLHAGQPAEAERLQREIQRQVPQDDGQLTVAFNCQNLAITLQSEGKTAESVTLARRGLDLHRQREGEASVNTAIALRELARAEELDGAAADAERDFRAGLRLGRELATSKGIATYEWKIPLADFLIGRQRCDEAVDLIQSALGEMDHSSLAADPTWRAQAQLLRGHCLLTTPQRPEAVKLIAQSQQTLRAMPGIEPDLYPQARQFLAEGVPGAPANPLSRR